MVRNYEIEREGQIDFFNNFHINYLENDVLIENTDGIWNGNIFEFKLNITDLNKTLFQVIKYLSRLRIKGESIPANILLISLNTTTLYLYYSQDYFDEIHKVYVGASSKNNEGFIAKPCVAKLNYMDMEDAVKVQNLLRQNNFMPIKINEDCIVGWAERYYRELPTANKGDFLGDESGQVKVIGEIREPKHFRELILPYEGETNEKFKYLMDALNDRLKKKDLGAFYTPIPYAKKAAELVRMAIEKVPIGNDYIILDRCAGTGNLEAVLTDEELSHCILSTYEYYEYKVLVERLGEKVRCIIPPTEAQVEYSNGCVMNADAMSKEYINNPILQSYIQNPNCSIILYENPPYRDSSAANKTNDVNSETEKTFVFKEMSEIKEQFQNTNISTVRDLVNRFVWSGFKYYLRQETDAYILLSPIKWWKSCGIVNCKFEKGYLFDRKYFHAKSSCPTTCIYWSNIEENREDISLTAIANPNEINKIEENIEIKKCYNTFKNYYENEVEGEKTNVFCESSGYETTGRKCVGESFYSEKIIGYLTPKGFTLDPNNNSLVRMTHYNHRGTFVTKENCMRLLPLFVAKEYPREKFYEKGETCIYFTTSDAGNRYLNDNNFLKCCFIYSCLSNQNKCLSFKGTDGREYQNELCFDNETFALNKLQSMTLTEEEEELLGLWGKILLEAKETINYDSHWKYGVYQITKELNTFIVSGTGKNKRNVYDYPELNGDLNSLRVKLEKYYKKNISTKLFEYELLK